MSKYIIISMVVIVFLVGCGKRDTVSVRQEINSLMENTFRLAYKIGAMDDARGNHLPKQRLREYMKKYRLTK